MNPNLANQVNLDKSLNFSETHFLNLETRTNSEVSREMVKRLERQEKKERKKGKGKGERQSYRESGERGSTHNFNEKGKDREDSVVRR